MCLFPYFFLFFSFCSRSAGWKFPKLLRKSFHTANFYRVFSYISRIQVESQRDHGLFWRNNVFSWNRRNIIKSKVISSSFWIEYWVLGWIHPWTFAFFLKSFVEAALEPFFCGNRCTLPHRPNLIFLPFFAFNVCSLKIYSYFWYF